MRPSKHVTFMAIAHLLSARSTCIRRGVGCVLVNDFDHIIGTGYNGAPAGAPHCTDTPCLGARLAHGHGLDACASIHAEQNALLQCGNVQDIAAIYTTSFPCSHCFKMLANTSCAQIFYDSEYEAHKHVVMEMNSQLIVPMEFKRLAIGFVHKPTELRPNTGC